MSATEVQAACEALVYAYARLIDFRDYEGSASLFAEDGELETGRPVVGRQAIFDSLMNRPEDLRSRHVMSNVYVDVLDSHNARGISYLTLYRHIGEASLKAAPAPLNGPAAIGHYEDRYRLTDDGWRFSRRKLHIAFANDQLKGGRR